MKHTHIHTHTHTHTSDHFPTLSYAQMMYFHFSIEEIVLFEWWSITSEGTYVASIVAIAALSMLREWLVNYRKRLTQRMRTGRRSVRFQRSVSMLSIRAKSYCHNHVTSFN